MNWKKAGKVIYVIILAVVLIFAAVVIVSAIPFPNGLKMYTVSSGSMEPTIYAGDLIFSQKQENYQVDDIITYLPRGESKSANSITHRIVKAENGIYTTQGDANSAEDADPVSPNQIKGKYRFRAPFFGYVVGFAKTTPGLVLLIIIPGTIIIYGEVQNIINEIKIRKRARGRKEKK